ncbi:hypothetical protein BGX28_000451 [Mortierella sp. GBA30]|nr:hypothetical protein BGX28_000451 [Mortierella sp. GBA30]
MSQISDTSSALQGDIDILREALSSLETRRNVLLQQIEMEEKGIIEDSASLAPPATTVDKHQRQMQDIMMAYRLTGVTIFDPKEFEDEDQELYGYDRDGSQGLKQIGIRFETFAHAKYHEPYYVLLTKQTPAAPVSMDSMDESQSNDTPRNRATLQISKHTIPHWIPLRDLERRYLNRDMSTFTRRLSDYLQAFVKRRENINHVIKDLSEASATFPGAGTLDHSSVPHIVSQSQDSAIRDVVLFCFQYQIIFKLYNRQKAKKEHAKERRRDMDIDDHPQQKLQETEEETKEENMDLQTEAVNGPPLSVHIHLVYDDLTSTRPTDVHVRFSKGNEMVRTETMSSSSYHSQQAQWVHFLSSEDSLVEAIARISDLYQEQNVN